MLAPTRLMTWTRSLGEEKELKRTDSQKISFVLHTNAIAHLHTCRIIINYVKTKEYYIKTGSPTVIMYPSNATCYMGSLQDKRKTMAATLFQWDFSRKFKLLFKKKLINFLNLCIKAVSLMLNLGEQPFIKLNGIYVQFSSSGFH